jgi:hypothetical protein
MKRILLVCLLVLLGLNAYLLLKEIDGAMGGGTHKKSPDEKFTLMANSLKNTNPFSGEDETYAEITLHEGFISGEVLKRIKVSPIHSENEMSYRYLKEPIQWNEGSSKVTFTTPDYEVTINLKTEPGEVVNASAAAGKPENHLHD